MTYPAFDTDTGSGDDPAAFATLVKTWLETLRNFHIGSSPPASPVEGMIWIDNTSATRLVVKLYQSAAWVVLTDKIAEGNRDFDLNQALNFVLEYMTTSAITALVGSTHRGRVIWDNTVQRSVEVDSSPVKRYRGLYNINGTDYIAYPTELGVVGASPAASADTNTRKGGWLLDTTSKELNWKAAAAVLDGWTGAHDLLLDMFFMLAAAVTAGDDVDQDMDWIKETPGSGDVPTKTVTAATTVNYDIGSATAQYALHKLRLTLVHDAAPNVIAKKDELSGVFKRNTVGGAGKVANIIVYKANLLVPVYDCKWN